MTQRKPIVIVDGRQQQIQSGDTLGGISSATSTGEAMVYDQFGANAAHMTPTGDPTFDAITGTSDATINGQSFGIGPSTGDYNLRAGTSAMRVGDTIVSSTSIGQQSLYYATGGSATVVVGMQSAVYAQDGSTPLTSPTSGTYIGAYVRGGSDTPDNEIAIGYGAIGLGDNSSVVGNSSSTVFRGWGKPTFGGGATEFTLDNAGLTAARTVTLPDASGTMTLLGNASTGSGSVVLATSPSLTTPNIGAATATTVNGVSITGTGTLATGTSTLTLSGTSSINQNVTTTGTPQFSTIGVGVAASSVAAINASRNSTDPSATQFLMNLNSTANTITANNANGIVGISADVRMNQAGFNYTATTGLRAANLVTYSSGSSGTVTTIIGGAAAVGNIGAGTLTNGTALFVGTALNSGGGTFTTNTGLEISAQTVGTNIYGIRSRIASTSGRYNLYIDGTADNYLNGNVGIGTSTFGTSAAKVLALFNGTEPSTSPADTVQLYSVDLSAGNATLGIRTETAVVTESVTSDRTLSVRINGTTYKLCLKS